MTSVRVSWCASPSSHVIYGFAHLKNELHVPVILYIYWCWINSAQVQVQHFVRIHENNLVISIMRTHTQDGGPRIGTWTDICQLWNLTKIWSMRKMWKGAWGSPARPSWMSCTELFSIFHIIWVTRGACIWAWVSNYIPQYSVGCNYLYLSMQQIPTGDTKTQKIQP